MPTECLPVVSSPVCKLSRQLKVLILQPGDTLLAQD